MNISETFNKASFIQNPYAVYSQLRAREKPVWLNLDDNPETAGMWLFSRYEDALAIFKTNAGVTKQIARFKDPEHVSSFDLSMLNQDPPQHTRLREAANKAFTPKRIQQYEPRIASVADQLLDAIMQGAETFDFIEDFARPLPVVMIAELLGVPLEDQAMIKQWSFHLARSFDSKKLDPALRVVQQQTIREMEDYFLQLMREKRARPQDDLISAFVTACADELSEQDLVGMCVLLLFAGHETTINLLGNGLYLLLKHPEQFALLQSEPALMHSAVEEMLRFESPAQRSTFRVATDAVDINGHTLEAGQQFAVVIGAANRDANYFEQADVFDITRTANKHLAFGLGIHTCIGLTLARKEAQIGLHKVMARLPALSLMDEQPQWNNNTFIRGLSALNLRLGSS